ncbi:MAG TPA: YceI family protein [Brumimicrobium sp.]|nr:YceI family protein [Brumimicrobium sp.]
MRKNTKFLFIALAGLMMSSCAGETETTDTAGADVEKEETCFYTYEAASSEMAFTAYKFLGKTGVGGTFTEINVEGGEKNEDAKALIEGLSFNIPISSLSTKDESRDGKINTFFFNEINTEVISGEVKSLDDATGKATLAITMNAITKDVVGDYNLNDNAFSFNAEIDVLNWEAQAGIDALNKECKELHTDFANGDTESKLWSDVAISFSTELKKVCE